MSSFISERINDEFYGVGQNAYQECSRGAVKTILGAIRVGVQDGKELKQLFHQLVDDMGKLRREIADASKTPKAELYGQIRQESNLLWIVTPLDNQYREYNDSLVERLVKDMTHMERTRTEFIGVEMRLVFKKVLNRKSTFDYKIWKKNDVLEAHKTLCEGRKQIAEHFHLEVEGDGSPSNSSIDEIFYDVSKAQEVKKNYPEYYKLEKFFAWMGQLRQDYAKNDPLKKGRNFCMSDYLMVTQRLEINGKMYAMSSWFTWLYRDFQKDPIEAMKGRNVVFLVHQDRFLLDETLKDAAAVFERVIGEKSDKELHEQMALLMYLFSHAMPYSRGSAACGEWLEQAIYEYKGYSLNYDHNRSGNLEALTTSFPEFVANYPEMIGVQKT